MQQEIINHKFSISKDSIISVINIQKLFITHNKHKYYLDDLREVSDVGVDHVMRIFSSHYLKNEDEVIRGDHSLSNLEIERYESALRCFQR